MPAEGFDFAGEVRLVAEAELCCDRGPGGSTGPNAVLQGFEPTQAGEDLGCDADVLAEEAGEVRPREVGDSANFSDVDPTFAAFDELQSARDAGVGPAASVPASAHPTLDRFGAGVPGLQLGYMVDEAGLVGSKQFVQRDDGARELGQRHVEDPPRLSWVKVELYALLVSIVSGDRRARAQTCDECSRARSTVEHQGRGCLQDDHDARTGQLGAFARTVGAFVVAHEPTNDGSQTRIDHASCHLPPHAAEVDLFRDDGHREQLIPRRTDIPWSARGPVSAA